VRAAAIRDARLRDEALRSAKGAALNCAEGAGRVSRPDKARAFAIARGETVEAAAAVCRLSPELQARDVATEQLQRLTDAQWASGFGSGQSPPDVPWHADLVVR
jgi:four helix bundle protein